MRGDALVPGDLGVEIPSIGELLRWLMTKQV